MSTTDSFKACVKNAIKGKYEPYMRRSFQTIALYEAHRCLEFRYPQLRPFQKKFALFATAVELLKNLDFLNFFQRQEIMFRTVASKEPLSPDLAWRRMKLITREINTSILTVDYKEVIQSDENQDKSHDEICDILLQTMYDDSKESSDNSRPHHKEWEFSHNNVFTIYRIYYKGLDLDPNIFPAIPPKMVSVPARKPSNYRVSASNIGINPTPAVNLSDEDRRAILKEVKDHTELLASFVGVIPDDELVKRKRKLYAALPPVPLPPTGGAVLGMKEKKKKKKAKLAAASPATVPAKPAAVPAATEPTAMEGEDSEKVKEEPVQEEPVQEEPVQEEPVQEEPDEDAAAMPLATELTGMEEEDLENMEEEDSVAAV